MVQFKKGQNEFIEQLVLFSNIKQIDVVTNPEPGISVRKTFEFPNNRNLRLIFEKRGNHRYWYIQPK